MESRSSFVTVLAWIFIIGAGFASIISIMQVIMVTLMFGVEELQSMPADAPAMAKFMQQNMHLFVYGFSAITLCTFAAAIGLLKRKNWARLVFMGILSCGVLMQIGSLILQFSMFSSLPEVPSGEGFDEFAQMREIMRWFSLAMAIGISGVFIWIIKKLATSPIAEEFTLNKVGLVATR